MIFVDTSAWYARYFVSDVDHEAAVRWFSNVADILLTTDYIVDELLTLLKVRGFAEIAYEVGPRLLEGTSCRLVYLQPAQIAEAWIVFSNFRDKQWSFTDCTSRVLMEHLNIGEACAFDVHFHQFGTVNVVP